MNNMHINTVLVTGGAGYVGSVLVPKLVAHGFRVKVLDLFIFGAEALGNLAENQNLQLIKGDLRDIEIVKKSLVGCDAVIHLACISNDPSFELNPELGKSINYDSFLPLVRSAKDSGVQRFIYASSSSVYGIKDETNVTEDLALKPLTDYSKYKAMCEDVLEKEREPGFATLTIRPATVCGYAPRLRLDLTVNILTNHAVHNGKILVFGGSQKRPNINIEDMANLYIKSLSYDSALIDGKIYNAGYENHTIIEIAELVRSVTNKNVKIEVTPTDDLRSYHISSKKIHAELGFAAKYSIKEAALQLVSAIQEGRVPDAMNSSRYYNIKTMQEINLT